MSEGSDNPFPPVPPQVIVNGIYKRYGATQALDGATFHVPTGSCTGLVGPNGSGKSTTLGVVVGLVRPDAGSVVLCGHPVVTDGGQGDEATLIEARRRVGMVSDPMLMWERLSAREYVRTMADLRGLAPTESKRRIEDLFEALELNADADRPIAGYSHGMQKKTALAAALVHRPDLLLLDEPFESVDPLAARTMRAMLDRYRSGGGTVVLSSHVMETVERLCDHVVIVARGRVMVEGATDHVRNGRRLEDVFADAVGGAEADVSHMDWLG